MFKNNIIDHVALLKALANTKRLEIISLLIGRELPVTDIFMMLDLPQANVSQHLIVLKSMDIVRSFRKGKQIYYALANEDIVRLYDISRSVVRKTFHKNESPENNRVYIDPVCHMEMKSDSIGYVDSYKNKKFYFCASGCLRKFRRKRDRYISHE